MKKNLFLTDISVGAVPAYLLDRENVTRAKILSNTVKQKRKEKVSSEIHTVYKVPYKLY